MRFKSYSKYVSSGVEWLGNVPEGWAQMRLVYLFQRKKDVNHIDEELLSVYRDYGVIPKSSRNDNFNKPSEDLSPYQLVNPGDLVLNKMKTWQGSIAISEYRGIVSPAYFVAVPRVPMHRRYMHHLLRCPQYIAEYRKLSGGVRPNQWDLDYDHFKNIPALLPSDFEQTSIAAFLDRETTKIDTLIAKQETLIDLLKEKRQAVISSAVTKGLDPKVPMKASGVEWLGEVPGHWEKTVLKHIFTYVVDNRGKTPPIQDSGIPMLEMKHIEGEGCYPKQEFEKFISQETYDNFLRCFLQPGDILFGTVGSIGKTAIVPDNFEFIIAQNIVGLRAAKGYVSKYLYYLIGTDIFRGCLVAANKANIQESIKVSDLLQEHLCVAPLSEQQAIVAFLDEEIRKIDRLIAKAEQAIVLQKEHRTALISAAVTGKIDVRNHVDVKKAA